MPPFDILLLPLVGGYLFLLVYPLARFAHQRLDRQRLLFHSIIIGILLVVGSYMARDFVESISPGLVKELQKLIPGRFRNRGFGTPFAAFNLGWMLGILFWIITLTISRFYPKLKGDSLSVYWAIRVTGDDFDKIFAEAFLEKHMLQITLRNNKVYVGYIQKLAPPTQANQLTILPVISGYRESETKKINFITEYLSVYQEYIGTGQITAIDDLEMQILVLRDEIITVNKFHTQIFDSFQGNTSTSEKE